jgi:superfamily II DNA or RNA helicase
MLRHTYLGQKGYTIVNDSISIDEQIQIKADLNVKPNLPGNMGKSVSFPIYRESPKKLYVPRFYGEKNFGCADQNKLSSGDPINVEFSGSLRPFQTDVINKYLTHVKSGKNGIGGGLLEIGCGKGKTVMALNIISQLRVKTLVIVHKGFLLNQWVERIQQFLPTARIGNIQGPHFDIEDKDIVIGMLQSLSMKEYPQELFSSFGFVCVDECHHISAEVFVRSLFVAVTPYVLGLSATMQRKDGLSKVFKHFIGGMVHSEKNDTTTEVEVRGIEYYVEDDEFNNIRTDYRGNPLYSCMISKLCDYASRTEFILGVLKDVLRENNQQQIIMLAHNKNLLNYIYKAIIDRNIADGSIGYYIGGMKDKDLKVSETKTIIMATYSMAAEALDIMSLTSLCMLTP